MTERAVSTALNYVLVLSITTVLISGLFIATGDFVADQRERAIESELDVLGNRIAADMAATDRLAQAASGDPIVRLRTQLPERVAETSYRVEIRNGVSDTGPYDIQIVLSTTDPDVTVTARVKTRTDVAETTLSGGGFVIEYADHDEDGKELVIRNA